MVEFGSEWIKKWMGTWKHFSTTSICHHSVGWLTMPDIWGWPFVIQCSQPFNCDNSFNPYNCQRILLLLSPFCQMADWSTEAECYWLGVWKISCSHMWPNAWIMTSWRSRFSFYILFCSFKHFLLFLSLALALCLAYSRTQMFPFYPFRCPHSLRS